MKPIDPDIAATLTRPRGTPLAVQLDRAAKVRERDNHNAVARGHDRSRSQAIRDIARADRDPTADRTALPSPEALVTMAAYATEARVEAKRLTKEIAKTPNLGRAFRRREQRLADRAVAKERPVYPLPVPRIVERKPTWGKREAERRVRQMAKGVRLST